MAVRRRKGSSYYWYDFTHGGRRYRGSTQQETKSAAKQIEAEVRAKINARRAADQKWKMRHLAGTYWAQRASTAKSQQTIDYQIDNLLHHLGKDTPIISISNADVAQFIAKRRADVSDSSVNRELTLLRAMLNFAFTSWDQEIPNINWKAHFLKEPAARDTFLTAEEYQALLENAHPTIKPIIIIAINTGLRKDNILSLQWQQIDLDRRLARFTVKGGKRHLVELNNEAIAAIVSTPNRTGKVFDTTNFRKRWEAALRASELEGFRFHDLRHTFASWARISGADLIDIKEALGHSDISTTVRYSHVKPGDKESAFSRVSAQSTAQRHIKLLKDND